MTTQESFKRRIRARMAKTGERYLAARRALLAKTADGPRRWVSPPEVSDARVTAATGDDWNTWVDRIDAWDGNKDGHTAVAKWLREVHDVDAWWAQCVTVGWERITGRRLPGQMPDGTFTANKSKTVPLDAAELRAWLLDDASRADLFGGTATELRSKPTAKALRVAMAEGVATLGLSPAKKGGTKVTIQHGKLPNADDVPKWKHFWGEWLEALAGGD